jgi:hypothetical protein
MQRERYLVATLLVIAAAIRIALNNLTTFSRADETVYLLYANTGYPRIVQLFLGDPGMWVYPNPLRWSYLSVAAAFCSTHHALATLSTITGIVTVALTWWIARELFDGTIALIATALVTTSPLQLAFGRRALADEFFCAAVLASIAALIWCTSRFTAARAATWIVATTIAIAAKEQFLFILPVMLLFWWLRTRRIGWRELITWAMPPLLFFAVYCALARDTTSFFQIARIITSAMTAPYAEQYQSGPPHRLLIDLLAIAPVVTIAAIVAIAARRTELAVLAVGVIAVHALLPSQNVRYILAADPLLRILVAAWAVGAFRTRVLVSAMVINALIELKLFHTIFIAGGVYDPVTDAVLRALGMLPR